MKIVFFIKNLKIEGVQIVTLRFAKLLIEKGMKIEIITLHSENKLDIPKNLTVNSLNVSIKNAKKKEAYNAFKNWYDKNDFDYLIASHGECINIISNFDDTRLIPFIHNSEEYSYNKKNFFRKYKYRQRLHKQTYGKKVICVSEGIKKFLSVCLKGRKENIFVLYNPINIDDIKAKGEEYSFNLNNNEFLIFAGRLEPQKRVDRLIKAFNLIENKNIKLLILGEGSLKKKLEFLVKKLELNDRVIFKDFVKNPYPIISAAQGLLLTSDHEGLPTVIIESLIVGTPVISVDCPTGPSEILTEELKCFLVSSFNETEIAKRIDWLLSSKDLPLLHKGYEKFEMEKIYVSFLKILDELKT